MLFFKPNGPQIQPPLRDSDCGDSHLNVSRMPEVCGFTDAQNCPSPDSLPKNSFGYFFAEAAQVPHDPTATTAALDALAQAITNERRWTFPAVVTNFGRFIDHDIVASMDTEFKASSVDIADVAPLPRAQVVRLLANLRSGIPDLDSIYGGATVQGALATQMRASLRSAAAPAKMSVGQDTQQRISTCERVASEDRKTDLSSLIPDGLKDLFVTPTDRIPTESTGATFGDARNSECVGLTRLHMSFLRLHNLIVDQAATEFGPVADPASQFDVARDRTRRIFQWMIVNTYLPAICDPDVLAQVQECQAPFYHLYMQRVTPTVRPVVMYQMPIPLEFSVAAFRLGEPKMKGAATETPTSFSSAFARKNLRCGQRLNVATGQACLAAFAEQGIMLPELSPLDIASGFAGDAAATHGFDLQTPLWFYIIKEAEVLGDGQRLGPLGSRLVAEVLMGLIIYGPDTYWTCAGTDGGRWHPRDDISDGENSGNFDAIHRMIWAH